MTDLIPVPRQDLELILRTGVLLTRDSAALSTLLADPPRGYWLSGEEVETLRKWRESGGWPSYAPGGSDDKCDTAAEVIDRILVGCPEPEQFSDEECLRFHRTTFLHAEPTPDRIAIQLGREYLTNLAAAGLYVTDAPR